MSHGRAHRAVRFAFSVSAMGAAVLGSACAGKSSDDLTTDAPPPGDTSSAGTTASGPSTLDLGGGNSVPAASGGGASADACASDTFKAERAPVNMFIQFDRSGSSG